VVGVGVLHLACRRGAIWPFSHHQLRNW